MRRLVTFCILLSLGGLGPKLLPQQNIAKTEIPGAGPCTNFPSRYQRLEERLAWFYGCMHENPPSVAEIRAKIAALPKERRAALIDKDEATQEALIGAAFYDLPIQIFPETLTPTPTASQQPSQPSDLSNDSHYKNSDGNTVHSPAYSNAVPAGATAQCRDGSYSFSQHRQGTCSHHGGVAQWLY
jgi:hypothetical protein